MMLKLKLAALMITSVSEDANKMISDLQPLRWDRPTLTIELKLKPSSTIAMFLPVKMSSLTENWRDLCRLMNRSATHSTEETVSRP